MDELELLQNMVSIYSPTNEEKDLAEFLVQTMEESGFQSQIDDVGNVIGVMGEGPEEILLVGHLDTVQGEISVRIEDGTLFGRGSVDAKSSLAAMICAASSLGKISGKRVVVIGVVDEEGGSRGARNLLARYNPKCVIVGEPSGWDSVAIGYKGCLKFRFRTSDVNKHIGTTDTNPAEKGMEFWNELSDYCSSQLGGSAFDSLTPRLVSFNTKNDGIRTEMEMRVDVRVPPTMDIEEVKTSIEQIARDGELDWESEEAPKVSSKNSHLTRAFISAIREEGGSPSYKKKLGTSDMNVLGNHWDVPIVAYGPGDSRLDHTPDERLSLDEYFASIRVLRRVLTNLVEREKLD
ncbi:MAG: [LysW]-lysine hydrolase [Methanobacteriota archaeon]|nr:MAG: [LysW]-lysine hydrolase [Euryarchaeota archaeon]